jgi:LytS/YehU family sensor histidine kinase
LPVFLLFTYGVIYYLVPSFLLKGKYLSFFSSLAIATAIAAFLRILVSRYVYYSLFIPEVLHPKVWLSVEIYFLNLIWIIGPAVVFAMFKYYKNWISSQSLANEAERKQLMTELQVLKAQLNPHFLFNTFNNLYVLALQKSDQTPVMISKMSDLFHYILYECNAVEVPLSKEIKLIADYIRLEELRYSDRLSISFTKDIKQPDCMIPPMMLYTFVENCFKHGCSDDPGSPWIKLSIRVRDNRFVFEASNSIPEANCREKEFSGGVGLKNIRRRLELIYPQNHQLKIWKEDCNFFVSLEIQMNDNQILGQHA